MSKIKDWNGKVVQDSPVETKKLVRIIVSALPTVPTTWMTFLALPPRPRTLIMSTAYIEATLLGSKVGQIVNAATAQKPVEDWDTSDWDLLAKKISTVLGHENWVLRWKNAG